MSKNGKWAFNHEEEHWYNVEEFDTKEEAVKHGLETAKEEGWANLFVGQLSTIILDTSFDGDDILLDKSEWIAEEYGLEFGFADDWLESISQDDTKLLEKMLRETFEKWLDDTKNHPKDMYTIEKIEQIKIGDD